MARNQEGKEVLPALRFTQKNCLDSGLEDCGHVECLMGTSRSQYVPGLTKAAVSIALIQMVTRGKLVNLDDGGTLAG